MSRKVPELSLMSYINGSDAEKKEFSRLLFDGLKDYGFIILNDHPIAEELLNRAYQLSEDFFNLPQEKKRAYIMENGGGQRGYTPFGIEHAKDSSVADLKEFWHVGRDIGNDHPFAKEYPQNIWPDEITDFQTTFSHMYQALESTGQTLLEALTGPLELESDYFTKMIEDGNSILRLLHYPPVPENSPPNALRAAPHEDINLITILVSATKSGLQLKDRDGKWLDVVGQENSLIVDAGDMLSRATNDVIPATTHQVVNPDGPNVSRFSMPFFVHPNPKAILTCIESCRGEGARYQDISAHDFLMQRLREIGLT